MPLYEYKCKDCGILSEILVYGEKEEIACRSCGSTNMVKQLSAHSAASGTVQNSLPGLNDTACCGAAPGQGKGCAGPGSCCGKG